MTSSKNGTTKKFILLPALLLLFDFTVRSTCLETLHGENPKTVVFENQTSSNDTLNFFVLGPAKYYDEGYVNDYSVITLNRMLATVTVAVKELMKSDVLGSKWNFKITYSDSNCSSTTGPLRLIDVYKEIDVVIGPVCDYVVSPVAKYTGALHIPTLTSVALADGFSLKDQHYQTLLRLTSPFRNSALALDEILKNFNWSTIGIILFNHKPESGLGNSACYFVADAIHKMTKPPGNLTLHSRTSRKDDNSTAVKDHLKYLSTNSRIILLCGSQVIVRRIMLAADDLGMTSSGEYVFVNIDFFRQGSLNQPWYSADDQNNNSRAQKAYESLLFLSSFIPETEEYMKFSKDVRYIAQSQYNYTYPDGPINPFVAAFYEAVMLYAVALNETIEAGGTKKDTAKIVAQMKNRTFKGISGDVRMDANGDRVSHYTLLDMNQSTGNFEVVANYNGTTKKLEFLPSKSIHWAGGRKEPPADTPLCGFDGSKCPKRMSDAAIVAIVGSVVITIVIFAAGLLYRKRQNWETHESVPLSTS